MAKVFAVRALDFDDLPDFLSAFGLQGAELFQNVDPPFRQKGITYEDVLAGQNEDGLGVVFAGRNFAVNGNDGFRGTLGGNDSFTGGRLEAVFRTNVIDGSSQITAGLQEISVAATRVQAVAESGTLADDRALLRELLSGDDSFDLSDAADRAYGYDGDDVLRGDGGADRLYGGAGDDRLRGVTGSDSLWGDAGADELDGGSGNDALFGGRGNDRLDAGTGADRLSGGTGRDVLTGGTDSLGDDFVFAAAEDSQPGRVDEIVNFTAGRDDIDLSAFDLAGFSGASPAADSVWVTDAGADLRVRADLDGDGAADLVILLRNVAAVGAGDFVL